MRAWTTKLVRHLIYTRFGIEYCWERVRQLLHTLGFRLRRLHHRHLKAKAEEQVTFKAELDAWLAEWPEDWELIFVDGGDSAPASYPDRAVVFGRRGPRGAHGG
jgi:hypothetical protein